MGCACIVIYFLAHEVRPDIAGWSSLVARRAHNPEVVGSNPAPATKNLKYLRKRRYFFILRATFDRVSLLLSRFSNMCRLFVDLGAAGNLG